mmetsp:Transcript_39293/g.108353  ORF Transcript_39293/g.108353 Transcript_39293/m.108353 type:complete len:282 (+) Transcript_39293:1932-2777(+)
MRTFLLTRANDETRTCLVGQSDSDDRREARGNPHVQAIPGADDGHPDKISTAAVAAGHSRECVRGCAHRHVLQSGALSAHHVHADGPRIAHVELNIDALQDRVEEVWRHRYSLFAWGAPLVDKELFDLRAGREAPIHPERQQGTVLRPAVEARGVWRQHQGWTAPTWGRRSLADDNCGLPAPIPRLCCEQRVSDHVAAEGDIEGHVVGASRVKCALQSGCRIHGTSSVGTEVYHADHAARQRCAVSCSHRRQSRDRGSSKVALLHLRASRERTHRKRNRMP